MDPSLEPSMAITIPGSISGPQVIDDLCGRIAAQLARDCSLRQSDAYRGYSARVRIELQLADVYPCEVSTEVAVGVIDPALPVEQIAVGSDVAGDADDLQALEKPVDQEGFTTQAPAQRRMYVSRIRGNSPVS